MNGVGKVLIGVWIGAISTFAVMAISLIANQQNINVPGEINEVVHGLGFVMVLALILVSIMLFAVSLTRRK